MQITIEISKATAITRSFVRFAEVLMSDKEANTPMHGDTREDGWKYSKLMAKWLHPAEFDALHNNRSLE